MDRTTAYKLFESMIEAVSSEIIVFTGKHRLELKQKRDKTFVTECDKRLDMVSGNIAKKSGLAVVSEERENDINILKSGNYIIIDAIDGTIGYIKHASSADNVKNPRVNSKLGSEYDYCFLAAIILKGKPRFGCCYNYVTGEKILMDSSGAQHTLRSGKNLRLFKSPYAHYFENRTLDDVKTRKDLINKKLFEDSSLSRYNICDIGFRALLAQLNPHKSAITVHFSQPNGLWDIAPACVAAKFTGAKVLDGFGEEIKFTEYFLIPGWGLTVHTGDKFSWIEKELKKNKK